MPAVMLFSLAITVGVVTAVHDAWWLLSLGVPAGAWLWSRTPGHWHRRALVIVGLLISLTVGFSRAHFLTPVSLGDIGQFSARVVSLDTPIRLQSGSYRGRVRVVDGGQILQMYAPQEWPVRQLMATRGEVRHPSAPLNPGELDFAGVLERQGVAGMYFVRDITPQALLRPTVLSLARDFLYANIARLPDRSRGLALALTLGDRSGLSRTEQDLWRQAGVNHILSVSGMHVAILAGVLYILLRKVAGFQVSVLGAAVFAIVYALLLGGILSAWRAALSFALGAVAKATLRDTPPLNILSLVAALMLVIMPLAAADPGFILSFVATAGLIILTPVLLPLVPGPKLSRGVVATSMAAQLATAPIVMAYFHAWPLYGLLANLLLVPLSALLVGGAFVVGVVGGVPIVGSAILYLFTALAVLAHSLVAFVANLPYASYHLGGPPIVVAALYYGLLLVLPRARARWGKAAVWGLSVAACALLVFPAVPSQRDASITFLAVGNADAIHLALRGKHYFVDTGTEEAGGRIVVPYLRSQGINTVEAAMITHTHADHAGGLAALADAVVLRRVYVGPEGPVDFPLAKPLGGRFRLRSGSSIIEAWQLDNPFADLNERSVVLRFSDGDFRALLAADIGLTAEQAIPSDFLPAHVLKVAHHGSRTSSGETFVRAVDPQLAVVTVGPNRHGHPDAQVMARLAEGAVVKRTDGGAVRVRIGPQRFRVYVFQGGRWRHVSTTTISRIAEDAKKQALAVNLCALRH